MDHNPKKMLSLYETGNNCQLKAVPVGVVANILDSHLGKIRSREFDSRTGSHFILARQYDHMWLFMNTTSQMKEKVGFSLNRGCKQAASISFDRSVWPHHTRNANLPRRHPRDRLNCSSSLLNILGSVLVHPPCASGVFHT